MFSLICTWINGWINNGAAGDLRRHSAHYDVSVISDPIATVESNELYDGSSSRRAVEFKYFCLILVIPFVFLCGNPFNLLASVCLWPRGSNAGLIGGTQHVLFQNRFSVLALNQYLTTEYICISEPNLKMAFSYGFQFLYPRLSTGSCGVLSQTFRWHLGIPVSMSLSFQIALVNHRCLIASQKQQDFDDSFSHWDQTLYVEAVKVSLRWLSVIVQ